MKYVSFPGLGIQPFALDSVAFTVFGIDVMWYGIIITCGMILAYLYGLSRAKIERVKSDDITDLTLLLILSGLVGARLYYVLFKLEDFIVTDAGSVGANILASLKEMVNVRGGGLAIYGGIIAGAICAVIFARIKKIRIPVILDILSPSVMIGQAVGRWGNFMNVEAYGTETALPWRMGIGINGPYVHPTFLYESLWNILGIVLITIFYKKKRFHGQIFLFYGIWYGAGRAVIEGLRTDSLMLGPVRVSQLLSALICIAAIVLMIIGLRRAPRIADKSAAEASDAVSDEAASDESVEESAEESAEEKTPDTEDSPAEEKTEDAPETSESSEDEAESEASEDESAPESSEAEESAPEEEAEESSGNGENATSEELEEPEESEDSEETPIEEASEDETSEESAPPETTDEDNTKEEE